MMNRLFLGTAALFGMATLLGCTTPPSKPPEPTSKVSAQDCTKGSFNGAFANEVLVPQNWNCQERQVFWFTDQGSQIIPYLWFIHLEQADSTAKFSDPANMDDYRYLPQKPTALNPDGLPIGFTKGRVKANKAYGEISQDWLGLTCAACHTGQIEFNNAKYLIEGAPAMGDFEKLFRELVKAMQATIKDEAKFERFANAVMADSQARHSGGTQDKKKLRAQLEMMTEQRDAWNQRNQGEHDYGYARLDAIGAIFNETAATALNVPSNAKSANAPVSYPFIWDTPQHDKVQWNGSVINAGPGALGRNVGEVLGVFGALTLNTNPLNTIPLSEAGHTSSVNIANLGKLEGLMWQLWSPLWRDTELPDIDPILADKGKAVYQKFCVNCHNDINRTDPNRRIKAMMLPVVNPQNPNDPNALGTDSTMAKNFLTRKIQSDRLTGQFTRYLPILSNFEQFGREQQNAKILGYSVIGAITREAINNPRETLKALKAGQPPSIIAILDKAAQHLRNNLNEEGIFKFLDEIGQKIKEPTQTNKRVCAPEGVLACYKARPLNGIWATAPYLHNGSVRTLRQLLLPADQRQKSFRVGTREFDPVDIGFKDDGGFIFNTSLQGNFNSGHDGPIYGNKILANDKNQMDALLEYLKTL